MSGVNWRDDAACATANPSWFDATTLHDAARALAVCADCPVTAQCRAAKPRNHPDMPVSGVWGGHVYGPKGQLLNAIPAPRAVETAESVGECDSCGRTVTARGRDNCPDPNGLCRQLAKAYHAKSYRRRQQIRKAATA